MLSAPAAPPRTLPVPLLTAAQTTFREFASECSWFMDPKAVISTDDDVRMVIENLRENGGHNAWRAAQRLQKMLLQCP